MNTLNYIFRYWLVLAHIGYEENYWDQVVINDLWAATITAFEKKRD